MYWIAKSFTHHSLITLVISFSGEQYQDTQMAAVFFNENWRALFWKKSNKKKN